MTNRLFTFPFLVHSFIFVIILPLLFLTFTADSEGLVIGGEVVGPSYQRVGEPDQMCCGCVFFNTKNNCAKHLPT